jgi:hypothetical protein
MLLVYSSVRGGGGDVQYCGFTQLSWERRRFTAGVLKLEEEICCLCTQVGRVGDANVIL